MFLNDSVETQLMQCPDLTMFKYPFSQITLPLGCHNICICLYLYLTIKTLSVIKWLFRVSSQG